MIFLDSSALLKRYLDEPASESVARYMSDDTEWTASELARTETEIALCRLGPEGAIGSQPQRSLAGDWDRFLVVPVDAACLRMAAAIGCEHRARTLDAIHVAAALRVPAPVTFLSFDRRQAVIAAAMGLVVIGTDSDPGTTAG